MKLLLAALAALCLGTSSPVGSDLMTIPAPRHFSFATIPLVNCQLANGSGVRISDDMVITAWHVVNGNGPCGINGSPIAIHHADPKHDFVVMSGKFERGWRAVISCEGIQSGQRYMSLGFTGGVPAIQMLIGTNSDYSDDSVRVMGKIHKGTSGGGVFDMEGSLVAINVRTHRDAEWGAVMPLSATVLCNA